MTPDDEGVTVAKLAGKTVGPVDRLEHPDRPGSHHQTPFSSLGSTATQNPGCRSPRSASGAVLTT